MFNKEELIRNVIVKLVEYREKVNEISFKRRSK